MDAETEMERILWPYLGDETIGWFLIADKRLTWRERLAALNRWRFRDFWTGKRPAHRWYMAKKPSEHLTDGYRFGITFKVE